MKSTLKKMKFREKLEKEILFSFFSLLVSVILFHGKQTREVVPITKYRKTNVGDISTFQTVEFLF